MPTLQKAALPNFFVWLTWIVSGILRSQAYVVPAGTTTRTLPLRAPSSWRRDCHRELHLPRCLGIGFDQLPTMILAERGPTGRTRRCGIPSLPMAATADASFPLEHGGGLSSSSSSKDEEAAAERDDEETASSVIGVTFSLMKTLVGTGMLALPSGLAAISDRASMLWPANAFMLVLGALSAYTFWILGRLAYATGGRTLSDTWTRVHRQQRHGMRSSTARVVSAANLVYCVGLCLAYSLVLGDSLSALLRSAVVVGGSSSSVPSSSSSSSWLISRHSVILAVTAAVLWPLCNLRSMKALEPFSVAGVLSSLFVTCFVAFRCPVLVPSSPYGSGGQFVSSLPPMLQPQFGTYSRLFSAAPVVMIALGCVAWMGHFSAPEFYHLLGGGRAPNEEAKLDDSPARSPRQQDNPQQLNKYKIVTVVGYSIVALLNALMLSCGFLTFGGRSQGNLLNNYAVSDAGATLSRFLVSVSVGSGYPLLFSAARSSALSLLRNGRRGGEQDRDGDGVGDGSAFAADTFAQEENLSRILLGLITIAALLVPDAGFVVSLIGAIAGTAIIYIFPSLLFLRHFRSRFGWQWTLERGFCRFLIGFGAVSAVMGTVAAVLSSYFPALLQ